MHHCKIRHIQYRLLVWAFISALSHCRVSAYLLGNNGMTRDGLVSDVGLFSPMVTSRSSCHVPRSSTSGILRPAPRYWDMPCLDCLCLDNASACRTFPQPYITHFLKPDLGEPIFRSGQPLKFICFIAITYQKNSRHAINLVRYIQVRGTTWFSERFWCVQMPPIVLV